MWFCHVVLINLHSNLQPVVVQPVKRSSHPADLYTVIYHLCKVTCFTWVQEAGKPRPVTYDGRHAGTMLCIIGVHRTTYKTRMIAVLSWHLSLCIVGKSLVVLTAAVVHTWLLASCSRHRMTGCQRRTWRLLAATVCTSRQLGYVSIINELHCRSRVSLCWNITLATDAALAQFSPE